MEIFNSREAQPHVDTIDAVAIHGIDVGMPRANFSISYGKDNNLKKVSGYPIKIDGRHKMHSLRYRLVNNSIEFEGSFSACKYGQNTFTEKEVIECCNIAIRKLFKSEKLNGIDKDILDRLLGGDVELKRLDLAINLRLTPKKVKRILTQIRRQLIEQYGPTHTHGTTVCWSPQDGKKYSIIFYDKGQQMRASMSRRERVPEFADKLLEECDGILRIELRLRASELRKLGLSRAKDWTKENTKSVFAEYMNKLKIFNVTSGPLQRRELSKIAPGLRPVLALHKLGVELSDIYSERTCQRHRSAFRELGIDLRCPNQPIKKETVNLLDYFSREAEICRTPQWLIDAGIAPGDSKKPTVRRGEPNRTRTGGFTRTSPKRGRARSGN